MTDIKPCPFCGCTTLFVEYQFHKNMLGNGFRESWVTCLLCGAQGPKEAFPYNMSLKEAAIEAWNER